MTKNDAYLKQMLVHCIIVRDGKSSCSQAVSIRRWLSGHFISFPTGGTETLTLTDNVTSAIVAWNFLTFQMLLWLTIKIKSIFHFFILLSFCQYFHLILLSILPSRFHLLFSSFFLFSHLCFFSLCLPPLYCFPFPSQYFVLSSFLVFQLLSFSFLLLNSLCFLFLLSMLIKYLTIQTFSVSALQASELLL